jgi:hypothetical protein
MDLGGALWIVIDIVLVVVFAGVIAYATFKWHSVKDNRRLAKMRDQATRRNYEEGG